MILALTHVGHVIRNFPICQFSEMTRRIANSSCKHSSSLFSSSLRFSFYYGILTFWHALNLSFTGFRFEYGLESFDNDVGLELENFARSLILRSSLCLRYCIFTSYSFIHHARNKRLQRDVSTDASSACELSSCPCPACKVDFFITQYFGDAPHSRGAYSYCIIPDPLP